jgi:hypothetical protein
VCGKCARGSHVISEAGDGLMASQHIPVICSTNLLQFKAAVSMLCACISVMLSVFCLVDICHVILPRAGSARLREADRLNVFGNEELLLTLRIW